VQQQYRLNLLESLWSPDGKWLIFRTGTYQAGLGDILAVRPGVDTVPTALVATAFAEYTPALSPDGRWLAYTSNETGAREVYVVPFPNTGTAKWAVSTQGGIEPAWAHSGRELFYRNGAGYLMSVQVSASPTFTIGRTTTLFDAAGFSASAQHQQYAVAPDDKRFLMLRARGRRVADKLIVVESWPEELKRTPR
jgi:serine/threonine-protein kinase